MGLLAALLLALPLSVSVAAETMESCAAAGLYDGSQMEMAAGFELGTNGQYRYALSYGALDEVSSGSWSCGDGGIVLSSDPSTSPEFKVLDAEENSGTAGALTLRLDGAGLPLPLFSAIVEYGDGAASVFDFSEDGLEIPIPSSEEAVSISLLLPIYEIRGEPIVLSSPAGTMLRLAFVPNDLGFKAFDNVFLPEKDGAFLLERYGRTISFRKIAE